MGKARKKGARASGGARMSFWRCVASGVLVALIAGGAALLCSALLLYRTDDPVRYFSVVAVGVSLLLSLLGGLGAGILYRKSGALIGLTVGMTLSFLFLAGALTLSEGVLPMAAIPLYLGMLLASLLGGTVATRKRIRRRSHR